MASFTIRSSLACKASSLSLGARGAHALRCAAPSQGSIAARGRLQVVNLTSNDLKNGMGIEIDNVPYRVVEFLHVKPGKGSAFVRSKLKNYLNGNTVEKTFRAGETLQAADMMKSVMQFTYKDGDEFVFMDMSTYEETRLQEDDWSKYLKEGMEADVLTWNSKVVGVQIPNTVSLEVVDTDPGVKGNTAQGGSKPATLETGAEVQVPLFINIGEMIDVDTRTASYLKRSGN